MTDASSNTGKHKVPAIYVLILTLFILFIIQGYSLPAQSVYNSLPADKEAVYFTGDRYRFSNDGKTDVSDSLQSAINRLKREKNFGIVFIPEGQYLISKTIYIPKAIRIIGCGKQRPVFILAPKTPGFQEEVTNDKGKANYMFWFTSGIVDPGDSIIDDANAGTFYSAFSNIDITIGKGNPAAVAIRMHFAQHSFVSHCDIRIGEGKAGVFDVGNFMENVRFFGGDYGIYTTKTSPGWQFMMLDTYFEGQRKAAIQTREAGLTIIRLQAENVPHVVEVVKGYWEKLYMQDCRFVNITDAAIAIDNGENDNNQVSLINIACMDVPVLATAVDKRDVYKGEGKIYRVSRFISGLQMSDLGAEPFYRTDVDMIPLSALPDPVATDIPVLPPVEEWVNLAELGVVGDGETDNSLILQEAINQHRVLYLPQGWYRVSRTITLKPQTVLIGLTPIGTQILIKDNTPGFSGFGSPVPLLEVPGEGKTILTGIGLSTGDYNSRAVACKWMAGEGSYMNDVKFLGLHGDMNRGPEKPWQRQNRPTTRENRIRQGVDPAWDTQYWSLWITNGGGGIFADIWSASTYATNGLYVSNTTTPGKIYAMSVEHHVRNEVRFNHVANWKVYALQLEEETRESQYCQPLEIQESENLLFANLYTFRVIRVNTPFPQAVRTWSSREIEFLNYHNYAQTRFPFINALYDIGSGIQVRPWEFTRLYISGNTSGRNIPSTDPVEELASGFEFAEGICSDSKGNIYFSEMRMKRIYRWSESLGKLSLIADFPYEPQSLACDSEDNLLVVFRYHPQPGNIVDGKPEKFENPPDARGTSYSGWGNSGFATWVYSIDPLNPDETVKLLPTADMGSIPDPRKILYPSNRWRDSHDFDEIILQKPGKCFVAGDGKTLIPVCYDLARSNALSPAFPGKPFYCTNEYDKRIVRLEVSREGYLSDLQYFAGKGEFSSSTARNGNVIVADGNLYIFEPSGRQTGYIHLPERPVTLTTGGGEKEYVYVTSAGKLFRVNLK